MLVVLVIITSLLGVLYPALQAARERARATTCQNNMRQLLTAMRLFLDASNYPPTQNTWPVELLPWLEEKDTLSTIRDGRGNVPRPSVFACPSHPDYRDVAANVETNLYVLVVWRLANPKNLATLTFHDRATDIAPPAIRRWTMGPEMSLDDANREVNRFTGPHAGGGTLRSASISVY
jgi:type II secretory pathway pseudopilin PulG